MDRATFGRTFGRPARRPRSILDLENGCIVYIVVSADDRFVVVPWAASQVDYRQRVVTLDVTREQIQPLLIDGTNWATAIGQPDFTQRVQRVFGNRVIRRERRDGEVRPRGVERREQRREQQEQRREARDRADVEAQLKDAPRDRQPDARPADGDRPRGRDAAAKGRERRGRDDRDRERRKDEPKKPQS